ncbi:MAG TPA: PEP/pyruvate-binding domain-containing protein [Candidatus Ozemobacteraceae bacterium]|nr:PEP/pyruvate-binding domain-containing protein [Candidatus Ozemobacteraceae bacterium]
MTQRIISPNSMNHADAAPIAGGKGANLLRLVEAGAEVPPFVIVSSRCFDAFVAGFRAEFDAAVRQLDGSSPIRVAETSKIVRDCICAHPLPPDIADEIYSSLRNQVGTDGFVAVRSSALGEDSKEFSYAGMLDTYLFCRTESEIALAVVNCWASMYSDRAVSYRFMRGIAQHGISMAVVVQEMIDGVASGVTFTVNPQTKYGDEILVNAVWGLGEGLVSGSIDADRFVVIKRDEYPIDIAEIAHKEDRVVFDREQGYGTIEEKVPVAEADKPSLTEAQVRAVAAVCHRIERQYDGVPQDIEWAVGRDGRVKILQARPITTIDKPWPSERPYVTLWDNSNIVESYSGVTTPLTFSFALNAYHNVYVQFCQVLGVPEEIIKKYDFNFGNMLGLLNGRIYYNLKNWYRLVSVLPGYSFNARFMEGMMGVKATFDFSTETHEEQQKAGFFRRWLIELPRMGWVGVNLAWKFWSIDAEVKKFMDIYTKMYNKYKDCDFDELPAHRLVGIYNELVTTVLGNWKAPIINDFMAMIFYGVLKSLIASWIPGADHALQNDLVAGQGNVESTLPMRAMQKMARFIKAHAPLAGLFQTLDAPALHRRFIPGPAADAPVEERELAQQIRAYLDEFGYRTMNELKLEEPSLNEKPEFLFSMLKNYAAGPLPPEEDTGRQEAKKREEAEKRVEEALKDQTLWGFIPKLPIMKFVTEYAKKAVAVREYQRFARTKMYGVARRIYIGIGRRLAERGVLDHHEDVFYLHKDEIMSYVVGTAVSQKLRELAAVRKAEFAAYRAMEELPDRIETKGIVYTNDLTRSVLKVQQSDDPNMLQGIGGCSGVVRKRVKVILNPSDDMNLNGEILVAARTDPGWVPLFATAAGLLIERGSMLSHSVIVARELGLPAIVGITGITKRVKTGDLVEMDGTTGIVRIIERADAGEAAGGAA